VTGIPSIAIMCEVRLKALAFPRNNPSPKGREQVSRSVKSEAGESPHLVDFREVLRSAV